MGNIEESDSLIADLIKDVEAQQNSRSDLTADLANVYAYRKDKDKTLYYLEQSLEFNYLFLEWYFTFPEYKFVYNEPRWDALLDKIGDEFNYNFKPD